LRRQPLEECPHGVSGQLAVVPGRLELPQGLQEEPTQGLPGVLLYPAQFLEVVALLAGLDVADEVVPQLAEADQLDDVGETALAREPLAGPPAAASTAPLPLDLALELPLVPALLPGLLKQLEPLAAVL